MDLLRVKVPGGAILYVVKLYDHDIGVSLYSTDALPATEENITKASKIAMLFVGMSVHIED